MEGLEIPWRIDLLLAPGGACFALLLLITAKHRKSHHIYVSGWYLLGALLWFPILYVIANFPGIHVGVQQATVNWWFALNVLGLWLPRLGVGTAYYLIPKSTSLPMPVAWPRFGPANCASHAFADLREGHCGDFSDW